VLRFVHNSHVLNEKFSGELKVEEIENAEQVLFSLVQRESFDGTQDSKFKTLNVFKDSNGLIKLRTKLSNSTEYLDGFKYPVVLPSIHPLISCMVRRAHFDMCHAGVGTLLVSLRERFWILKARKTVKSIVSKCVRCRRYQSKNLETEPVGLPRDRIGNSAVFQVIGVDLAGPLYLRGGDKSWIVLYTCAVYRVVHLELVMSLSTESFLQSLRRFVARRGRPSIIYSDNGTNFVGAENGFKTLNWKTIEKKTAVQRIQWRFNPPTAAWWGGFWERLIRIMKDLLRRVLGKASLNYEELLTTTSDIESVINSRPLCYVSDEADGVIPLTPSMFIQDIQCSRLPEVDTLDRTAFAKRWEYRQKIKDTLRLRFRKEYLSQLIQVKGKKRGDIQVGDIVLIGNDIQKRMDWPLGKVLKLIPGKDGISRVVEVKTASGVLTRPIQRIYPLEVSALEQDTLLEAVKATPGTEDSKVTITRSGRKVKVPSRLLL